jgi:hypothetical protein
VTDAEITAAVAAQLDRDEAAGLPRTATPEQMAEVAKIVYAALSRKALDGAP